MEQTLGFHTLGTRSWVAAVWIGCQAVEYSIFWCSQTRLPMEVGSLYQVALGPKGPKLCVGRVQTLGVHKMKIRLWDAAVWIACQAVEYSLFLYIYTSKSMKVGSLYQIALGHKVPWIQCMCTNGADNTMGIRPWDTAVWICCQAVECITYSYANISREVGSIPTDNMWYHIRVEFRKKKRQKNPLLCSSKELPSLDAVNILCFTNWIYQ